MNLFKRNMFGELNVLCFVLGHKWGLYGRDRTALCMRCEVDNPRRLLSAENIKEGK